jgi:LPS O-antigen subunit length determinant protein (WzzB/FepE family)
MYFKQIDKLLSSVVDVTNQSQTIMFTKYPDGSMLASLVLCGKSATDEDGLEDIVEGYVAECKKSVKLGKEYRLKQLQDEIDKIKLENDFNDDL